MNYAKIDPYLTRDLAASPEKQRQIRELTQQLQAFQVTVVASNIEDLSALNILSACGVEYIQGFSLQQPREEMSYDFKSDLNSTLSLNRTLDLDSAVNLNTVGDEDLDSTVEVQRRTHPQS